MQNHLKKLIFVIDDSLDNLDLLQTLFSSKGYQVHCASNGQEALSILKELSQLPDLILLDAQMPTMNGYQFRLEQKKIARLKNIPVLIMSGDADVEMNKNMLYPQGIVTKPLSIKSILENVQIHI